MFDRILNATLSNILFIARRRSEQKLVIIGVTKGNLGLTLPLNSFDLNQTQNQKMNLIDPTFLISFLKCHTHHPE